MIEGDADLRRNLELLSHFIVVFGMIMDSACMIGPWNSQSPVLVALDTKTAVRNPMKAYRSAILDVYLISTPYRSPHLLNAWYNTRTYATQCYLKTFVPIVGTQMAKCSRLCAARMAW